MTAPQPSSALATRDEPAAALAEAQQQPATPRPPVHLVGPQDDLEQAFRLAKALAMSTIIPESLRGKPSDILVITLYGQELGLAPMQAMQVIDVVKGRPTLRANLWVALARRAGHKVRVPEATAEACTVTVIRHDDPEPITVRYAIEDAKQARLLSNSNYQTNPAAMLYARAASTAIRRACPEVAMGFSDEYELTAVDDEPEASPLLGVVPPAAAAAEPAAPAAQPTPAPAQQEPQPDLVAEYADIAAEAALFDTPGEPS